MPPSREPSDCSRSGYGDYTTQAGWVGAVDNREIVTMALDGPPPEPKVGGWSPRSRPGADEDLGIRGALDRLDLAPHASRDLDRRRRPRGQPRSSAIRAPEITGVEGFTGGTRLFVTFADFAFSSAGGSGAVAAGDLVLTDAGVDTLANTPDCAPISTWISHPGRR